MQELSFTVSARIAKPVHEVFEAVADPGELSAYFTTGGAKGRMETGATVTWDFADFPGAFPVTIAEVVADERIVLHWGMNEEGKPTGRDTTVTMTFEGLDDGRTLVSITESGWSEKGLEESYGNCSGWMQMLCAMKAYLEYRINIREGMFV